MYLFTIITATYNAASMLPRLLESLAAQTCRDFELIIQDGASTDETVSMAESYRHRLPSLSLVSEPDTGIYDAWNKALPRVRGEWVLFLGADDVLATPQVLESAKAVLHTFPASVLFAAGDLALLNDAGVVQKAITVDCAKAFERLGLGFGMPLPHSALFTRRDVFLRNTFDASYKVVGDYDFIYRAWKKPQEARALHLLVTHMSLGGMSSNSATAKLMRAESRRCARKHFPLRWNNCHRYVYLMAESYLHDAKMRFRGILQRCPLGRNIWKFLQTWRKSVIDQGQ